MRAARCGGLRTVLIEDLPRPVAGPGDVVVAVRSCGICGSDLHRWHGELMRPRACPGHESAGKGSGSVKATITGEETR